MQLEDVQRSFTRLIDGIGITPYETRLQKLQLNTLLERRMRGYLIETYRIVTGKVDYTTGITCSDYLEVAIRL